MWHRAIRTGRLEPELHAWLLEAYATFGRDDAVAPPLLPRDDAARLIEHARAFVEVAHWSLGQRPDWPA